MLRHIHSSALRTAVPLYAAETGNGTRAPRPITALIVDPSEPRQLDLRRALDATAIFDRRLSATDLSRALDLVRTAGALDAVFLHWSVGAALLADPSGDALLGGPPILLLSDDGLPVEARQTLADTLGAAATLDLPVTAEVLAAVLARTYARR